MKPILAALLALSTVGLALPNIGGDDTLCDPIYLSDDRSALPLEDRSLSVTTQGRGGVSPWPNGELHVYFADSDSRKKIFNTMQSAFAYWRDADPRLSHLQLVVDNTPTTTSMITKCVKKKQSTSTGYDHNGGHKIEFDPDAKKGNGDPVTNMIHELGHAFGLYHEHQRPDSADYINFDCSALKDYKEVAKAAEENGDKMENLCKYWNHAKGYEFSAKNFISFSKDTTQDWDGAFDYESIMRYGTYYGAYSPLIGKKKQVIMKKNGEEIVPGTRPSKLDVERMVKLYG